MVEQPSDRQVGARPAPNLVGRADLVARLGLVIASGDHRLITLLGPGGVGKTSLARSLSVTGDSPPVFIELAAIDDDELILPAIAAALGLESTGAGGLLDAVVTALGAEPPLLILDNLEQLRGADRVIRSLLDASPNLTILATSRTRVRLPGELVIEVEPLAVPAPATIDLPVDELRRYAAIELFETRAQRVLSGFELTTRNGPGVAEIVRRLDGIPLAIELVTSRARSLSITDISAHLDELLPLPARGDRSRPGRQETILASIAWSFTLLPNSAQTALTRLAVFPGSFDLDAARAVTGAGLGDIDLLLEHHLLRLVDRDAESHRFGMPESVRQFGLDHLRATGDEMAVRERHAAWVARSVRTLTESIFGPRLPDLQRRHRYLADDQFHALAWAIGQERIETALELYIHLNPYQFSLPWDVGLLWWSRITPLLDRTPVTSDLVAVALVEAGRTLYGVGSLEASDEAYARAYQIAKTNGNANEMAMTLARRGEVLRGLARPEVTNDLIRELRALSAAVSEPFVRYTVFTELGAQAMFAGELDQARADFETALMLTRAAHASAHEANALHFLGYVAALAGELDRGRDAFQRSIRLFNSGPETQRLSSLHGLGRVELLAGHLAGAYDALSQALAGRQARSETLQVRLILTDLALLARASGRPRLAAEWLGAVGLDAALLSPKRFFADRWIEAIDRLRAELGVGEFERALERGRLIGLAEAVESALAFATPSAVQIDAEQAESAHLSPRELEVLRLIVDGASDRQIAETLFISPLTATRHVKNILHKLDAPTRTAAAMLAVRRGIIRTDS
ncbi:MAG: hypothetical protein IT334_07840 [Thermomicrobiales bacterium]|nr:hypothetical protein [Thermomicrobiales bacterium]